MLHLDFLSCSSRAQWMYVDGFISESFLFLFSGRQGERLRSIPTAPSIGVYMPCRQWMPLVAIKDATFVL